MATLPEPAPRRYLFHCSTPGASVSPAGGSTAPRSDGALLIALRQVGRAGVTSATASGNQKRTINNTVYRIRNASVIRKSLVRVSYEGSAYKYACFSPDRGLILACPSCDRLHGWFGFKAAGSAPVTGGILIGALACLFSTIKTFTHHKKNGQRTAIGTVTVDRSVERDEAPLKNFQPLKLHEQLGALKSKRPHGPCRHCSAAPCRTYFHAGVAHRIINRIVTSRAHGAELRRRRAFARPRGEGRTGNPNFPLEIHRSRATDRDHGDKPALRLPDETSEALREGEVL